MIVMIRRIAIDDPNVSPALILASGVAKGTLGGTTDSYPEGSCFFISVSYVATARHCGEILREDLGREGLRENAGVQPYGQHVFDPRLGLTWKAVNEIPLSNDDISVLEVTPEIEQNEDATEYLPWCEIWKSAEHPAHPVIRMSDVVDGEQLSFRGFTDIKFSSTGSSDATMRLNHEVSAVGMVGHGVAKWQEIESLRGIERRLVLEGVAAQGLNSGSPVLDVSGRIVGVVSMSPQEGYTVIAPFYNGEAKPAQLGRHMTKLKLSSKSSGDSTDVAVLCDWD